MSTVQEIQNAIAEIPEPERLRLFNWIHAREEDELGNDPETVRQAEEGARQLDAGEGVSLEEARSLFRPFPVHLARTGNKWPWPTIDRRS